MQRMALRAAADPQPVRFRGEEMKLATSFFAVFCGWASSFLLLMLFGAISWGRITDFNSLLWNPLMFGFLGWIIFGLPFVYLVPVDSRFLRFPWSPLVGACLSLVAYWILIGWALVPLVYMHVFAGMIGVFALPIYSLMIRRAHGMSRVSRIYLVLVSMGSPFLLFFTFQYALWPSMERLFPGLLSSHGTWQTQQRILERTLEKLEVGDAFEDLRRRLPDVFREPAMSVNLDANGGRYTIYFKDGKVSQIERSPE